MGVFSTNQVRQLYVAKELKSPKVVATDKAGALSVNSDNSKSHLYFEYKGADTLMRSDLINISDILSIKATKAEHMAYNLKTVRVALNKDINGGNLVGGQDYILRVAFRQYVGMSEEDQYFKYGMVHAVNGMSATTFYKELAVSLAKNFTREYAPLVNISLVDHTTSAGDITTDDKVVPVLLNGLIQVIPDLQSGHEYSAVIISEAEQEWTLGIKEQVPVYFTVQPVAIKVDGDEVIWGVVTEDTPAGKVLNGKKIADLEYFCMGERGDMYRNIGWPHSIPTKYLVDPTLEYNVIDIHYFYVGSNEGVQKSEKTITLVVPKDESNTLTTNILSAINTATGMTVELK